MPKPDPPRRGTFRELPLDSRRAARSVAARSARSASRPPGRRGSRRAAAPNWRRRLVWIVPVVLLVGAVAWVGVRGLLAKSELEQAQALIRDMKQSAAGFDLSAAGKTFTEVEQHAEAARSLTSDPVWRLFEFIPVAGRNLTVVRELSEVSADTVEAIKPLADLAGSLDPATLAPVDGAIPLEPFERAVPLVAEASDRFAELTAKVEKIDASGTVDAVTDARKRVADLLDSATPALATANTLLPLIPPLLGSEGVKTYVVMFQNNAEARSLGGTALSFALVTIDEGRLSLVQTVPAGGGNFRVLDVSPFPVPDGFEELYPETFGRFIPNATLRPSFPSAAQIVSSNWTLSRGITPDGIISIDAVALSYVLRATGPVPLSTGDVLDSENIVRVLLNEVLQRYNSGDIEADNVAQDAVYSEAVGKTFAKLSGGQFDVAALMQAVAQGFTERRFTYWSSTPDDQAAIAAAGFANDLPKSDDETDGIGMYVNSTIGAKLNFFLRTYLSTASAVCTDDGRQVHRLTFTLQNEIDPASAPSLSPLVAGVTYAEAGLVRGDQSLRVLVYAPPGATFLGATIDGVGVAVQPFHDTDRPVAALVVVAHPGAATVLSVDVAMGTPGERHLDVQMTPGVHPTIVTTAPLDCGTVPIAP
ncbi:MAG: DUF4012 domain-containing protein [Pseudolysinimonas sp.]